MTKLVLIHKINKFYHIFWEVLGYDFEVHICNFDNDFLLQVLYDISEALEAYDGEPDAMCKWLNKLNIQIINYREKTTQKILFGVWCILTTILLVWFTYSCAEVVMKSMSDINIFSLIVKFNEMR